MSYMVPDGFLCAKNISNIKYKSEILEPVKKQQKTIKKLHDKWNSK